MGLGVGANFCNPVGVVSGAMAPRLTISAFPNPVTSLLTVLVDSPSKENNCTVELWSSYGKKVAALALPQSLSPGEHTTYLNCENLVAGTYQLVFSSDHAHFCKKVVIID